MKELLSKDMSWNCSIMNLEPGCGKEILWPFSYNELLSF